MNLEPKFYYGLPKELWENLLFEAEDLLRDEELGSHLVGIFPAGGRIFGIESESPGIFCLYIDSVESLIDPFLFKQPSLKLYHVGNSNNLIAMMDLWAWARAVINLGADVGPEFKQHMLHLLPFGATFHTDQSINEILLAARQLVYETIGLYRYNFDKTLLNALSLRAETIFMKSGSFYPCLNKDWDFVYDNDNNLSDLENTFVAKVISYTSILASREQRDENLVTNLRLQLGTEVARLYRSLV